MTKITQNTQNYSKIEPSKQNKAILYKNTQNTQKYQIPTKSDNFYIEMLLVC